MDEFELLVEAVRGKFTDATIGVDRPEKPNGNHWLDVTIGQKRVTVEHRPGQGFGFFVDDTVFTEGPNEIVSGHKEAYKGICDRFQIK